VLLVYRADHRAADSEIVLESQTRSLDLATLCGAAQLLGQLVALGEAGRAKRMTFR